MSEPGRHRPGTTARKWERRIERASELAAAHPSAAEALRFYERIAGFQRSLYTRFEAGNDPGRTARPPGSLRDALDLPALLPSFPPFLALIQEIAPFPLAQSAAALAAAGEGHQQEVLDQLRRSHGAALPPAEALLAWAFLQPAAEALADRTAWVDPQDAPALCPLCSGRPQVGILRPLGDGGKRSLVCSLCATEWAFRRLVCPACGEEDVDKLPVYVAQEIPHVRVEACDTCRHYLKTVDLTKDGRAVPVVDELAAIPLALWAAESGYRKWRTNLMGL